MEFQSGDVSLYAYAFLNPANNNDPSGLITEKPRQPPRGEIGYSEFHTDECGWSKKICKVYRIEVEVDRGYPKVFRNRFEIHFTITIYGHNLTKCEYAQFAWNDTSVWDLTKKKLNRAESETAFSKSGINFRPRPEGWVGYWGKEGQDWAWKGMSNDEVHRTADRHGIFIPRAGDSQLFFKIVSEYEIRVRDKATKAILWTWGWGYSWSNFKPVGAGIPGSKKGPADNGVDSEYGLTPPGQLAK